MNFIIQDVHAKSKCKKCGKKFEKGDEKVVATRQGQWFPISESLCRRCGANLCKWVIKEYQADLKRILKMGR